MPIFSIIVPVYNVEKYVAQCIESIQGQTFADYEVLVVDDCGNDDSMKIVKRYAKNDSRIKIFKHTQNRGLAAARNTALKNAQGEYIVCLDSDDWMDKNCLSVLYSEFKQQKTTSIWFNAQKYYEESQTFEKTPMYNNEIGLKTLEPENIASFSDFSWIKAYTRDSIQKYNLNWPVGLTFEDGEFFFKYFTLHPRTYFINDCLIYYRHRESSIVREADRGNVHMEHLYKTITDLRQFWIKNGVYEKYKITILKLIQNRIRMMKNLKYTQENIKLSLDFLKELQYPEDFYNQKSV